VRLRRAWSNGFLDVDAKGARKLPKAIQANLDLPGDDEEAANRGSLTFILEASIHEN
jgi:hypothetical protein